QYTLRMVTQVHVERATGLVEAIGCMVILVEQILDFCLNLECVGDVNRTAEANQYEVTQFVSISCILIARSFPVNGHPRAIALQEFTANIQLPEVTRTSSEIISTVSATGSILRLHPGRIEVNPPLAPTGSEYTLDTTDTRLRNIIRNESRGGI